MPLKKCKDSIIQERPGYFCLLICVAASQLIKPSPETTLWGGSNFYGFIFYDNSRIKGKLSAFFSFRKVLSVFSITTNLHSAKTQYRKFETNIPRKGTAQPQSQFTHSFVYERFIYFQDRSTYFPAAE